MYMSNKLSRCYKKFFFLQMPATVTYKVHTYRVATIRLVGTEHRRK